MQKIKTLFLHLSNTPISYYRMIQFAEKLKEHEEIEPIFPVLDYEKHEYKLRDYELNPDAKASMLNELFYNADVVICQNTHTLHFLSALKMFKEHYTKPLIIELDDNPFSVQSTNEGFNYIGSGTEIEHNAYDQIRFSDACILSTEYLKNVVSNITDKPCYTIPNCLNLDNWKFEKPKKEDDKIILGWSGASGHNKDLSLIKNVFIQLLEEFPNLYIKCLHGAVDLIKHERFNNELVWTNILNYPEKLNNMGFDIAVAPLWDNEFNRCKSNLRYLEYSALKIPCVASNVEPYKKTIIDGFDGFLANSQKEFIDKIKILIQDKEKIASIIAENAFLKVEKEYNLNTISQKYADIIKEVYKRHISNGDVQTTSG